MAVTNLPFIQAAMVRYGMTVYFALGLVGNICNCIIFTRNSYRRAPSSIYFLSLSIFAIIYLLWSLFPSFYALDHTDLQTKSLIYCKVRLYGSHILGLYIRYCIVFACFDRFISTRRNAQIRLLNSVQMALKLVFTMCVVWLVVAIHMPILMDIRGGVCGQFDLYKFIYAIYQAVITGFLPPILMIIFSTLTMLSLHQLHDAQLHATQINARKRDRYLLRMVIAEVMVNIFTSIPYSANQIYGLVTFYVVGKSAQRLEIESFITFLTTFLVYLISVGPFYMYILASKPFRNEFINIFLKCWGKHTGRQVGIAPSIEQKITFQ
jgi:hypothetical protein